MENSLRAVPWSPVTSSDGVLLKPPMSYKEGWRLAESEDESDPVSEARNDESTEGLLSEIFSDSVLES